MKLSLIPLLLFFVNCVRIADKLLDDSSANSSSSSTVIPLAIRVYGQLGSFTTNDANKGGISADSLNRPTGVSVDSSGVYVAENQNFRALFFPGS